ncbi:DUF2231 domain-containing protein [Pseudofrankia asymbiotica]|uniref:Uncharacterized protein n=1 Tax=Pseudofrankia asymbiotica TaxID=1834516 RepID=A0A1V2IBZ3_9ACTN|nr:DUF2231 domain-containing protein [Pseudofrankia asymbiotica]ONH30540.1 hypothetical protein BL253_13800 [Pseudofrankia asymbiotica]
MPATVSGLPTHALIIHATVALVPLAAVLLVLVALWPRLRRALGPLPAIGAAVALILVPITTSTGDKLKDQLGVDNPLVNRHAELGEQLLPWVAALFVAALVLLFADGWRPTAWATPAAASGAGTATASRMRIVTIVVSVIVIALAVVTVVEVIRIGHAGAEAVWQGVGSS